MMATQDHPDASVLSDYALGQLPWEEIDAVAEHVDQCQSCQETLSGLECVDDTLLGNLVAGPPPQGRFEQEWVARQANAGSEAGAVDRRSTAGFARPAAGAALPERLRDYRLVEQVGAGGMGAVYRAVHERLDRPVAVKVLPIERNRQPQAVARFHREMKAVGNLDHPNVVRAYDAGDVDGKHFLAMELVDGVDLSELVDRHGPLAIADACELIRQAAVGLQAAHDGGLIHRDVKPSNLMLDRSGVVKVLDLGLARVLGEDPAEPLSIAPPSIRSDGAGSEFQSISAELTGTDQVMGTPDYMAPEQCVDGREVDARTDVYGLGATLYKLLCGRAPFGGPGYETLAKKIAGAAHDDPPPPTQLRSEIPGKLQNILLRMLDKDPANRLSSAAEAAEQLAPFCAGHRLARLAAADSAPSAPLAQSAGRGRVAWFAVAAAGAAVAAALWWILTDYGHVTMRASDDVKVEVLKGDEVVKSLDLTTEKQRIRLRTGEHEIRVIGAAEFEVTPREPVITRGSEQVVRIDLRRAPPGPTSVDGNWTREIEAVESILRPAQSPAGADLSCDVYTKAYDLGKDKTVQLTGPRLHWKAMPRYIGVRPEGRFVDERTTLVLNDEGRRFWPVIVKMNPKSAELLVAELIAKTESTRAAAGIVQSSSSPESAQLSCTLSVEGYTPDENGRIAVDSPAWRLRIAAQNGDAHAALEIGIVDQETDASVVVVRMPLPAAQELAEALMQIETSKRLEARAHSRARPRSPHSLAAFDPRSDVPVTASEVEPDASNEVADWKFTNESDQPKTIRLFEIVDPDAENCVVTYRLKMKTKDLQQPAFLEMWARIPALGESFSRGLDQKANGTNDWASYETVFFLKPGQRPDLLKLNVVLEGRGTVWVRDVEVLRAPLPQAGLSRFWNALLNEERNPSALENPNVEPTAPPRR